ncbi:MAG: hypothetical protein Q8P18_04815 [Pseudomonadota bacterium]|nr:hypothetical protein [Pseudomonadota bacterium]
MTEIPWAKLGIPESLRAAVEPAAPRSVRLAAANAALPAAPEALLGMLYVLACGEDPEVGGIALASLKSMPGLLDALSQRTHAKVLELIATTRPDRALDERIMFIRGANDRTATLIASRADEALCDIIAENHERLLLTPQVIVALHQNPRCAEGPLERAIAFMRMQQSLPELPPSRTAAVGDAARPPEVGPSAQSGPKPEAPVFDLEAEIEAALSGRASPHLEQKTRLDLFNLDGVDVGKIGLEGLEGFVFDFKDDDNFSFDLLDEGGETAEDPNVRASIEKRIAAMSVGKKLKLAYLGNKSVRSILIRDRNKLVSVAVVKSGRLTDAEVLSHAGNRNLPDDVLREIATNREWTRKYPVKVALVNNPKCPPSVAVSLVTHLQIKDLTTLSRNRNVSSVVFTLASKMAKQKSN